MRTNKWQHRRIGSRRGDGSSMSSEETGRMVEVGGRVRDFRITLNKVMILDRQQM